MGTAITYERDVVREKSADGPFLLEGEEIRHDCGFAIPPSTYFLALVLIFIPPLFVLWSVIAIGLSFHMKKSKKLWLTDRRLVYAVKPLVGAFTVVSIPISEIKLIRRRYLTGILSGLFDQMFGVSTIQVFVKGHLLPQVLIQNVKDAGTLLRTAKSISMELVEGE